METVSDDALLDTAEERTLQRYQLTSMKDGLDRDR